MDITELGPDVRVHYDTPEGCWLVAPEPGLGPVVGGPAGVVVLVPLPGAQLAADVASPTWLVEGRFGIRSAPPDPAGVALAERIWGPAVAKVIADDDRSVEQVIPLDLARRPARAAAAALAHHVAARPPGHDAASSWALVVGALAGAIGLDAYAGVQRQLGQSWLDEHRDQLAETVLASGSVRAAALAAATRRLHDLAPDPVLDDLVGLLDQLVRRAGDIDHTVTEGAAALSEGDQLARILRGWSAHALLAVSARGFDSSGRAVPAWLRRAELPPDTLSLPVGLLAGPVELTWDDGTRTLAAKAELAPSSALPPALWLRVYEGDTGVVIAGQRCAVAGDRLSAEVHLSRAMTTAPVDVDVTADPGAAPLIGDDAVFREATNNANLATGLEAHARHREAVVAYRRAARRFDSIGHAGLASLAHRFAERAGRNGADAGGPEAARLAIDVDADRDDADRLAAEEPWALVAGRCLTPLLEPLLPELFDALVAP